uniref:Uncharacterized protein n=1 Tax=Cucumis melo TaxID=3656 RepID=A0A9I9EGU1_CUCME
MYKGLTSTSEIQRREGSKGIHLLTIARHEATLKKGRG